MALEDEVLSRQMPHDLDAEQAVLGSMLFDAECIKDVMDKLLPEDFYLKQNRDIFTVAYNMFSFSKPIDPLTLAEEMRKSGVYDEQTTRSYLAQLVDFTFSSANVMDYVKILRDKSLLRGLSRAAGEIDTMVQEGLGEASAILEAAEQKVYAIRRGRSAQELVPISQLIVPFLDRLGELSEGKSGLPGLPSGFSAVDQKIHGLNKSDLVLLAARPGVGKSSFALNMALNVAKQSGKTVAIFSLEMSREQLLVRLMSSEGLVDLGRLMTGRLSPSDWGKITQAGRVLRDALEAPVGIAGGLEGLPLPALGLHQPGRCPEVVHTPAGSRALHPVVEGLPLVGDDLPAHSLLSLTPKAVCHRHGPQVQRAAVRIVPHGLTPFRSLGRRRPGPGARRRWIHSPGSPGYPGRSCRRSCRRWSAPPHARPCSPPRSAG